MTVLLRHAYQVQDTEVKSRTLILRCVPIGVAAMVADSETGEPYRERFASGAFDHIDPRRTELRLLHSPERRYGLGARLEEEGGYLLGHFPVTADDEGDYLLRDVNDGRFRGVSVGFIPGYDRHVVDEHGPLVERVKVKQLREVSLVHVPAYPGSELLQVRQRTRDLEELRAWMNDARRLIV
jgi:HK97 family phage prohead protease